MGGGGRGRKRRERERDGWRVRADEERCRGRQEVMGERWRRISKCFLKHKQPPASAHARTRNTRATHAHSLSPPLGVVASGGAANPL